MRSEREPEIALVQCIDLRNAEKVLAAAEKLANAVREAVAT